MNKKVLKNNQKHVGMEREQREEMQCGRKKVECL